MAQIVKMRMKTRSLKRNTLPIAYCALKFVVAGAEKLIGEDRHVDLLLVDGRARRQRHCRAHLLAAGAG